MRHGALKDSVVGMCLAGATKAGVVYIISLACSLLTHTALGSPNTSNWRGENITPCLTGDPVALVWWARWSNKSSQRVLFNEVLKILFEMSQVRSK